MQVVKNVNGNNTLILKNLFSVAFYLIFHLLHGKILQAQNMGILLFSKI